MTSGARKSKELNEVKSFFPQQKRINYEQNNAFDDYIEDAWDICTKLIEKGITLL